MKNGSYSMKENVYFQPHSTLSLLRSWSLNLNKKSHLVNEGSVSNPVHHYHKQELSA